MYSTTITLRPNGSMTLPKKLRSKYKTAHYVAMEMEGGVFLRPVRDEIEYYEKPDGTVGLHFPYGIDAGRLADMIDEANKQIDAEEKKKKRSAKKRRG